MKILNEKLEELEKLEEQYRAEWKVRMEACSSAGHPNKILNPNYTPHCPWDSPSKYFCPDCGMGC